MKIHSKKYFFLAAIFLTCVASLFCEWIPAEKFSFVSYSYFLMGLYLARCYLFCIAILGVIALCKERVGLATEFLVFLPVVIGGGGVLCALSFNAIMLYSRIVTVLQIAVLTALFARMMFLFYERQKIVVQNSTPDFSKLSNREKEVAVLLLQGKTNDEIAAALFISSTTVKSHVQHIFEKYNSRNRMEFAAKIRES